MRSTTRLISALVGVALLAALTASPTLAGAGPATYWVDDDHMAAPGNCDSATSAPLDIQATIDAANPGDTIMVCPGLYEEQLSITKNDLTIRSVKKWKAIIAPPSGYTPDTDLVTISTATGVVFRGFRFHVETTGDCAYVAAMVTVTDSPFTQVRGNKMGIGGFAGLGDCGYVVGVYVYGASSGTEVNRNRITDFRNTGILVNSDGSTLIKYNHISFFHAAYATAPYSPTGIRTIPTDGGVAHIHLNRIRSLDTGGDTTPRLTMGIYAESGSSEFDVRGNKIRNVDTAIYAIGASGGRINHNIATSNIQNGLLFNQSTYVYATRNQMSATEKGIQVDSSSMNNTFTDNDWGSSAAANDCNDASSGGGTANTANAWENNIGATSSPPGICSPAP